MSRLTPSHWFVFTLGLLAALALITLPGGGSGALAGPPVQGTQSPGPQDISLALLSGEIPIQGRLTDASGNPLNGSYSITASLYVTATGGTARCSDTETVVVNNGLFNMNMGNCASANFSGSQLYLGIQVGADPEMTPRQPILPVPYAMSLRPGAVITGSDVALSLQGEWTGLSAKGTFYGVIGESYGVPGFPSSGGLFSSLYGVGVSGQSTHNFAVQGQACNDTAGCIGGYFTGYEGVVGSGSLRGGYFTGYQGVVGSGSLRGVAGSSDSSSGTGVFAQATGGGVGLRASSHSGTAIAAEGTGIITSTADSYVFVPGSALVKENPLDSTRYDLQVNGSARVWSGYATGQKRVIIPITLPGVLYGQPVTVKSVRVYYKCENGSNNYIRGTDVTKQTDADSFSYLVNDLEYRQSNSATFYTLTPTANNVLSSADSIVTVRLALSFVNDTQYIQIGGVRLGLGHE